MAEYNNSAVTKWLAPDKTDFLLPGLYSMSYNYVGHEIPQNGYKDTDGKVIMTSQNTTRTFKCKTAFNKDKLHIYFNGDTVMDYVTRSSNTFILGNSYVGKSGWIWTSYEFITSNTTLIYADIPDLLGVELRKRPASFKIEYIRELCTIINKIEAYIKMPQTLWIGGEHNESYGTFNIIMKRTPVDATHFVQLAESINELVYAISALVGGIMINKLIISLDVIPTDGKKLWTTFIEKCRSTIYEIELILIKM